MFQIGDWRWLIGDFLIRDTSNTLLILPVATRRTSEYFLAIAESDGGGIQEIRTILGERAVNGHAFANFKGIPGPPAPEEHGWSGKFNFPIDHFSTGILRIQKEAGVRINPVDLRNGSRKRCRLGPVILRSKGVMSQKRARANAAER
jgi:hypothetical protein